MAYTSLSSRFLRILEPESARRNTGGRGKNIALVVMIFIPVFIYTWLYIQTINMNYEVNRLKQENEKLRADSKKIEMKLQAMMSNEKIMEIAIGRYGFKKPAENQVFVIKRQKNFLQEIMNKFFGAETKS